MSDVQVSSKHKALVVNFSPEARNLFPAAKELTLASGKHLVVPHEEQETYLLRKVFGYDVPAPILSQYDWVGGDPFAVQKKTCAMLTMNQRGYVLNGMGTGKTKAMLWAWDYLRGLQRCGKLLVLAPLSTVHFTWAREVFATLPHRKCVVLHGTKTKRLERLADPEAEIFIINHDGLNVIYDEVAQMVKAGVIDVLGIDELAVYRNGQAARTKVVRKLAAGMKWVWGMSGAPIPHSPTDVWAQASIITPGTVPKYFNRLRDDLMVKVSQFKYIPKSDAVDRAFAVLQPAVRYTLDDVVELPELVVRYVDVPLGTQQAKVYKSIASTCFAAVQNNEITAANAGAVMNKLLQVSTGYVYAKDKKTVALDNTNRIDALVDAINATDRKVLVFAPFKHALAGISAALGKEGIEHEVVSGDTSSNRRSEIFNMFQNTTKYKVLVAHPQCLAHGITLTAADTIVWFAPVTSLEIYEQANARIRRVGQKHKQLVLHLQGTAVEKKIYALLQSNQKVQDQLLSLFAEASE